MKKFFFIDLDDTLFKSEAKFSLGEKLQPAAYLKNGLPGSFMNTKLREFYDFFDSEMTLIPTTARDLDSFSRVDLLFKSYKILNFGGIILNSDGLKDETWSRLINEKIDAVKPHLLALTEIIKEYCIISKLDCRIRLIEDFEVTYYLLIKDSQKNIESIEKIKREIVSPWLISTGLDFSFNTNGNNLAILPNCLNKQYAVEYVKNQLTDDFGEIMTFAMGDSRSDANFMSICDYAIIPRFTQLSSIAFGSL